MNWLGIGLAAAGLAVLLALAYWQMIVAEGAYLCLLYTSDAADDN